MCAAAQLVFKAQHSDMAVHIRRVTRSKIRIITRDMVIGGKAVSSACGSDQQRAVIQGASTERSLEIASRKCRVIRSNRPRVFLAEKKDTAGVSDCRQPRYCTFTLRPEIGSSCSCSAAQSGCCENGPYSNSRDPRRIDETRDRSRHRSRSTEAVFPGFLLLCWCYGGGKPRRRASGSPRDARRKLMPPRIARSPALADVNQSLSHRLTSLLNAAS